MGRVCHSCKAAVRGGRAWIGRIVGQIEQDIVGLEDYDDITATLWIKAVLHAPGDRVGRRLGIRAAPG
jgi:hypothetical protein